MYAVIWTTTPWTIPANQALNVHPGLQLCAGGTRARSAGARAGPRRSLPHALRARQATSSRPRQGAALERIRFRHPFYDRASPVYLGDYVTLEQGTGIVHSSPAYGIEDFLSCRRYGMKDDEILNPVQGDGRYAGSLPFFGGVKIWEANPQIVDKLREVGALLHAEKFTHSYMHCWRHKTPIIYRATTQWFAAWTTCPAGTGTSRRRRCARRRCAASRRRSSSRRGARRACTA